jgi:hypothetical protein
MAMAFRSTAIAAVLCVLSAALPARADFDWPMSLRAIDAGYPEKGSPCRRVGETAATSPYLDDSSILVGCPGARSSIFVTKFAAAQNGRSVAYIDGVTLIAIPLRKPGVTSGPATRLRCTLAPGKLPEQCAYHVVRKGGGISVVTITQPDGKTTRSIFFANGRVTGADVKKPESGPKPRITSTREVDRFIVAIGGEEYEVPVTAVIAD